jgi:hypothetical protein
MAKKNVAESASAKYQLNKEDLEKIGVGLIIALGGAALTFFEELVPNFDFGVYTPLGVALNSALINAARKFLSGI